MQMATKSRCKKIYFELKEKAKSVDWHINKRKEYYCIIAKSFKDKPKEKNLLLLDLRDLDRLLWKTQV